MEFETFLELAIKATCIFCHAEKAVGAEEYADAGMEQMKERVKESFVAAGWSVICVKSVAGAPDVVGMACPDCVGKGKPLFQGDVA